MIKQNAHREEFTLRDTFKFFRHQKWVYAIILAIVLAIWAVIVAITQPVYQATTVVSVEGRASSSPTGGDPLDQLTLENTTEDIVSLIELMRSEAVLRDAFQRASVVLPPLGADVPQPDIQVQQLANTKLVQITVLWTNAEEARKIAEQITPAFNDYIRLDRNRNVDTVMKFLADRQSKEQQNLAIAEQRLEAFDSQRPGLAVADAAAEAGQRASTLELQSRQAQTNLDAAKKKYDSLVASLDKLRGTQITKTTATNLERIEAAKKVLEDLQLQRTGLVSQYTDKSPQVVALNDQIAQQKLVIKSIPRDVVTRVNTRNPNIDNYQYQVDTARAEYESALAASVAAKDNAENARHQVGTYIKEGPQRSAILREIDGHRVALASLAQQKDNLNVRMLSLRSAATPVTAPYAQEKPVRPRPVLYLAIALVAWLVVGTGVSLIREQVDDRVLGVEDAYEVVDSFPTMGVMPALSGRRTLLSRDQNSQAYNSLRRLGFSVAQFVEDPTHRTVAVMSAGRREGRTALAVNLASQLALSRKAILVDADFERPQVAKMLNLGGEIGLAEVLLGRAELGAALKPVGKENLLVLGAGSAYTEAMDLLGGEAMAKTIGQLAEMADVVIFDTMPVLRNAESLAVASLVDGVLLVLRLGSTRRDAVASLVQSLQATRANLMGFVFTQGERSTK